MYTWSEKQIDNSVFACSWPLVGYVLIWHTDKRDLKVFLSGTRNLMYRSTSKFISAYNDTVLIMTVLWISIHSGRVVWGMNRLRPLEHWDRWFESHSGHACVCVHLFCVGSGLATGWSPVQGVLQTVYGLRNWKSGRGPQGLWSHR
jgi:hypothetical protein